MLLALIGLLEHIGEAHYLFLQGVLVEVYRGVYQNQMLLVLLREAHHVLLVMLGEVHNVLLGSHQLSMVMQFHQNI